MRIILLSIITLIIIITSIACAGRCGPSNYIPTGPDDCKSFGNSTHACCYLTMRDAPADYKICYWMDKTDVTPVISIGKLSYRVDCEGMDDFYKYFPLENKFYPVSFVYIKSTEGTSIRNKYYASDYTQARKHGVKVGAYHFFSTRTSGAMQARFFLKNSRFRSGDLPDAYRNIAILAPHFHLP